MKINLNFVAGVPRKRIGRIPAVCFSHASNFFPTIMIGHNRIGASAYTNSTPKATIAAEAAKQFANPPAAIVEQVNDYEHIKARIDNAIERQKDGRKALAVAIRDMLETKAYRTKYKTIAAFALHEYGKSARWLAIQLEELTAAYTGDKEESEETPKSTDTHNNDLEVGLKNMEKASALAEPEPPEEPEKPAVHSADEVKVETNGHTRPKENGKPKGQLALWGEMETYCGRSLNRADELNRQCPNPRLHAQFIQHGNICMNILNTWKQETK